MSDLALLKDQAVPIWFDNNLRAGSTWRDALAEAIDNSSGVIFFVSAPALESSYCSEEINYALSRDKQILTVFSEPVALSPGLHMALGNRQALFRIGIDRDAYLYALTTAARDLLKPTNAEVEDSDRRSIAVLRFENLSSEPDNAYLADGIAEELLIGLAQVEGISVASKGLSFAFGASNVDARQIGQQLNVAWVLDGTVRRVGDKVRVTVSLIETHNGVIAWAEKLNRQMADIFDLQDDIAKLVLQQILQHFEKLSMGPILNIGTSSVEAYNAYLQGKHESLKFTSEALDLSIAHLRRAIRLDPNFLRARVKLIASLQSMRMTLGRSELSEVIEEEKRLLRQHDPDGRYVNWVTSDNTYENSATGALELHERLLAKMLQYPNDTSIAGINPDRWAAGGFIVDDDATGPIDPRAQYGLILANSGLYKTALDYILASQFESSALSTVQIILGRLEAASNTLKKLIHAEPQVIIHRFLYIFLLCRLSLFDDARDNLDQMESIANSDLKTIGDMGIAYWSQDEAVKQEYAPRLESLDVPIMFKGMLALGTSDEIAMRYLLKAQKLKEPLMPAILIWVPSMVRSEDWLRLNKRDDFQKLLDDIGVGAKWRAEMRVRATALSRISGIAMVD